MSNKKFAFWTTLGIELIAIMRFNISV